MTKTPEELTEDWKAGKLDVGFYYVKGVDGLFGIMSDYALYRVNLNHSDNEMTLLAPVPTYDEYKAMQSAIQNGESAINGDFENINSSAVCYAWFVWEKGYKGQTIIDWIN